ncbi:MAG: chemotaxis protein CheR [Deltaproteobacteria bacterium]|nr:chemotaxis protein CheR [Deltaproteobacteria bacterium]
MTDSISEPYLSRLSDFIALYLGLHFPQKRWQDLDRAMSAAAVKLGFDNAAACARWLLSSPPSRRHIEVLASCLTVGESYFFREMKGFEAFLKHILPDLIASRSKTTRRIRIWSAGCATGEEPYTIAMLLDQKLPSLCDWDINILATDINPFFLKKAKEGLYSEWSFRGTRSDIKERYFIQSGDRLFRVAGNIKKMVTFDYFNLVEDPSPLISADIGTMDVIFCRNVLMYFDTTGAGKTARRFYHALTDGGWLIVSPAEASQALFSEYATENFPGAILFRKPATDAAERKRGHGTEYGIKDTSRGMKTANVEMGEVPASIPFPGTSPTHASASSEQEPPPQSEETENRTSGPPAPGSDLYAEASELLEKGLNREAAAKALALLHQGQSDAQGMALLARAYANGGEAEKALEWCRRAVAAERLNAVHYYLLATIAQEMDQTEAAAKALRQALYLDQDLVPAHIALGVISRKTGSVALSEK